MTQLPKVDAPANAHARLARQALKRGLSEHENRLAAALEQLFRNGIVDLEVVAASLQDDAVQPPSGASGPWSAELIRTELAAINMDLDQAYRTGGAD